MSDENQQNQGLLVAHPPAEKSGAGDRPGLDVDPDRAAKVGATKAIAEAAMAGLAQQLAGAEPEAEQPSLLFDEDEPGCLFRGPVAHVANIRDAAKRGRGRPPGSQNKRSADLSNYLLSMGYRDPALNLADLANASPVGLALELSALPPRPDLDPHTYLAAAVSQGLLSRDQVIGLMAKATQMIDDANAELMPYFHPKKPQAIQVDKNVRGFMVFGEMPEAERPRETLDLRPVGSGEKGQ
ncbi:hypothetical protein ACFHWW_27325 [Ensifer sp. P24N7]|uniref:hypothetical protein n=1 Tax=Sinorhizobium sp. P24N7 TaxID=3348358 RepID=UPI0035F41ACD